MTVSIAIPWRDLGCPYRRANFEFVTAYWRSRLPDAELVVSGGPDPFSRAGAINAAIRESSGDLIFQCDPDSLVTPEQVVAALDIAQRGGAGLVVCHDRFLYLDLAATTRLLKAGPVERDLASFEFGPADCEGHGMLSTNIACFTRATWERAGGYEERFGMWGADDSAFALACGTLVAQQARLQGDWIHLWHPRLPQSKPGGPGYAAQMALLNEYHAAADDRAAMRRLVSR